MNTQTINKELLENSANHNHLYSFFLNNSFWNDCDAKLKQTPWHRQESEKSLVFCNEENISQVEQLRKIFDINTKVFEERHTEAISGDGHEERRILTLHSSSLLSLLCFYQVSKSCPLRLYPTQGLDFKFTNVRFEKQNKLSYRYKRIDDKIIPHDSNMDIMLWEGDYEKPDTVLFLESKFTEYLSNGAYGNISTAYKEIFDDLGLLNDGNEELDMKVVEGTNKFNQTCFILKSRKSKYTHSYLGGIKQMISHFMGACTYASEHTNTQVYLGSVVYQFEKKIDKGKFENYKSTYQGIMQALQKLLEKHNTCSNLHLIDNLLTYNEVFSKDSTYKLDEKVAQYYYLE